MNNIPLYWTCSNLAYIILKKLSSARNRVLHKRHMGGVGSIHGDFDRRNDFGHLNNPHIQGYSYNRSKENLGYDHSRHDTLHNLST